MNPLLRLHKRAFAWVCARGTGRHERQLAAYKRRYLEPLAGRVLELGVGAGPNLRYLDGARTRVLAVEPNPYFRAYLEEEARARGVPVTLVRGVGEALPFATGSLDAAICCLVLCSVGAPGQVLAELRRVLRPGGRLVLFEHVAAPGGPLAWLQAGLEPFWGWLADGCHLRRDHEEPLRRAGFVDLELERPRLALPLVGPHLVGRARAP